MKLDLTLNDLKDIICELQAAAEIATTEYEGHKTEPVKAICEHLTNTVKALKPILKASSYAYEQTASGETLFYLFSSSQQRDVCLRCDHALRHADFYVFQKKVGEEWTNLANYDCDREECGIVFALKP